MQVEQKNLWENVTRNAGRDVSSMAIAAYQANMPVSSSPLGIQQESFEKSSGVSEAGSIDMATYADPRKSGSDDTVAQEVTSNGLTGAESRRNEVAVLANTTSAEDLKELEEDGFSLSDTDSRTIVTVTDKIKATLAEAGVDISGYGDGLTKEQLEEITGSAVVTNQIMQALAANDLPATDANVEDCAESLEQLASMDGIDGESMAYLLKNELEPTIGNLYLAQHSSTAEGITAPEESAIDFEALLPQMEQIIEAAGLAVDDDSIENSEWLVANKIPLTAENLQYLSDLQDLSGQMERDELDWGAVMDAMAKSITEGKRPQQASLLTARRQLEETRLAMTTEASASMQKRGIEIDTQPLTELVEDLKAQEKEYYRDLLDGAGVEPTEEKVSAMAQTMDFLEEMKGQPSYVLGQIDASDSLQEIHDTGAKLQQELKKASESYETLMTSPRRDMGDSIQKAFTNVDDILKDMDLETTDGNRRAVRILAYSQTAITQENVTEVKALDEQMQRTFRNMTPAVTLEMIRKGENPLDMNMEELNRAAEEIRTEQGNDEEERFSKYLYKLEQNNEISEEERSGYIGIYRLIAQVEKTDGAAIGFLRNEGADLTMRNLLRAVRTRTKGEMDYSVSDDFDGVDARTEGPRIDAQIETAFQQNCLRDVMDRISPERLSRIGEDSWADMTPEQFAEALAQVEESGQEQDAMASYAQEQLELYRQVLDAPEEVYAYLEHYDIPNSMANILAASEMLRSPNRMMERLFRENRFTQSSLEKIAELKQQVFDEFEEALRNPSEMADAQETLAEVAEHVMDDMIIEEPNVSTQQIRDMRQMVAEFSLCSKRTEEECYMIPIQTGDSVTGVSLRVVRGKKEKGLVDIFLDSGKKGKIAASFRANEQGISGMIAVDDPDMRQQLLDRQDELEENLGEKSEIHITYASDLSLTHFELTSADRAAQEGEEPSGPVQTKRLYHIAEAFIQSIRSL